MPLSQISAEQAHAVADAEIQEAQLLTEQSFQEIVEIFNSSPLIRSYLTHRLEAGKGIPRNGKGQT